MANGADQTTGGGHVIAIQLLRVLAAATVTTGHLAYAFADHVGPGLGVDGVREGWDHLAQVAVRAFFLVSGFVMVVSTARLFGAAGGTRRFVTRRLVRIAPPYWIATFFLVAMLAWHGVATDPGKMARSLVFVPDWVEGGTHPLPVLWPGWTLTYELAFYVLFGLGVSFGRKAAVLCASAVIVLLVAGGAVLQPTSILGFVLTRPCLLLFIAGMALALWREQGHALPGWLRLGLGLLSIPAFLLVPSPPAGALLGFAHELWAGLPALFLFLGFAGGDWRLPFPRAIDLLGNASYALYLLHVPMGHVWSVVWPSRLYLLGPWAYYVALCLATLVASIAFWLVIERPLTRWLNARLRAT